MARRRRPPRRTGPNSSLNDRILDALVRHQVFLQRFAGGLRNRFVGVLNATESRIRELIMSRKGNIGTALTTQNQLRAERLIARLLETRTEAWDTIAPEWRAELRALVRSESAFLQAALQGSSPVELNLASPAVADLVARHRYNGRNTTGWIRNLRSTDLGIVGTSVRTSVTQGESPRDTAVRMLGRRATGGRDGALQATRNNVASVARTSVTAMQAATMRRLAVANAGIMSGEIFVAVLDGRTTPICRSLDGRRFPTGVGPIPPLHVACRSIRQMLIDGEAIGNRTATPLFTRRTLNEYTDTNGLARVTTRDALPRGHKGRFDSFRQQRAFEVIGPNVPVTVNYEEWLRRQPARFQDDVLGVTKGKLFRKGGLGLDRFVDQSGRELTLSDMATRDRAAFGLAGLDADNPLWDAYVRAANPGID